MKLRIPNHRNKRNLNEINKSFLPTILVKMEDSQCWELQYKNGYSITFKCKCECQKDTHGFPRTS